jgi:hypothetical protein
VLAAAVGVELPNPRWEPGYHAPKLKLFWLLVIPSIGRGTNGTPGRVQVVQTGLFMAHSQAHTWDGFPGEKIILSAVGQ